MEIDDVFIVMNTVLPTITEAMLGNALRLVNVPQPGFLYDFVCINNPKIMYRFTRKTIEYALMKVTPEYTQGIEFKDENLDLWGI